MDAAKHILLDEPQDFLRLKAKKQKNQSRFFEILRSPRALLSLDPAMQTDLLRLYRRYLMLGVIAQDTGLQQAATGKLADHLDAANRRVHEHRRQLLWETRQIVHALKGLSLPVVLLKGAAYEFLALENARGRLARRHGDRAV